MLTCCPSQWCCLWSCKGKGWERQKGKQGTPSWLHHTTSCWHKGSSSCLFPLLIELIQLIIFLVGLSMKCQKMVKKCLAQFSKVQDDTFNCVALFDEQFKSQDFVYKCKTAAHALIREAGTRRKWSLDFWFITQKFTRKSSLGYWKQNYFLYCSAAPRISFHHPPFPPHTLQHFNTMRTTELHNQMAVGEQSYKMRLFRTVPVFVNILSCNRKPIYTA